MCAFSTRVLNTRYTIYTIGIGSTNEEIEQELSDFLLKGYVVMVCGI